MQVVIDIDENVFTRLFDNGTGDCKLAKDDLSIIVKAIRKGTTLPKGHGRLKDVDKLESHDEYDFQGFTKAVYKDDIDALQTIIEADNSQGSEMLSADRRRLDNLLKILEDVVPKKYEPENEVSKE